MSILCRGTKLIITPRMVPNARLRYEELKHLPLVHPIRPLDELFQSQLPSGYSHPLGPSMDLPFTIERTKSGNLPVYRRLVLRSQIRTRVQRIQGDLECFAEQFELVTGKQAKTHLSAVEAPGDHRDRVLIWLWALGF
mmetsp:Transcript_78942/g.139471  ORF Transcript_78942/g.139471 Transcript_78942/m.139471 type:complete len:138 (-) Transcript_78942:7-420(-)